MYAKIRNSRALKPYLDKYAMLDDDHTDHSFKYLIDSIQHYQQKTRMEKNLDGLTEAVIKKSQDPGGGQKSEGGKGGKSVKALAAKITEQCPFWVSHAGCKWLDNCNKGKHDPECKSILRDPKSKGGGKTASGSEQKSGDAKGKAGKDGKGSKGSKDNAKGAPAAADPPQNLPDTAVVDSKGRALCYRFVHGKCTNSKCRRYHGPETKAMREKRIADEAELAKRRAAGADASQTDVEGEQPKPKAQAKSKAKP